MGNRGRPPLLIFDVTENLIRCAHVPLPKKRKRRLINVFRSEPGNLEKKKIWEEGPTLDRLGKSRESSQNMNSWNMNPPALFRIRGWKPASGLGRENLR